MPPLPMRVAFRSLHAVYGLLALSLSVGSLAAPAVAQTPAPAPRDAAGVGESPALDEHFREQRWSQAVDGYRRLVEAEPENARAWFRLGYALHALERWDEALECHEQAAVLPSPYQVVATYNAACARALRGEVDLALEWLERAIDSGFRKLDLLDSDPDLNNLRTDPRFKRLRAELVGLDAAVSALPCPAGHPGQFDFLVGRWRSRNWTRTPDGAWEEAGALVFDTRPVLGGEAIFTLAAGRLGDRDVQGLLLRHYDAERDRWITVKNWPDGKRAAFSAQTGCFRRGRAEFFSSFHTGRGGEPTQTRGTISDVGPDHLRMDSAVTTDGGRTWEPRVVYELERAPAAAAVEAAAHALGPAELVAARPPATGPEFRAFDFLLGEWRGERVAAACGTTTAVRASAEAILGGAALIVETRSEDEGLPVGTFEVLGYEPGGQRWVRYAVERGHSGLVRQEGRDRGDAPPVLTGRPGPGSGGSGCRQRWLEVTADRVVSTCERRAPGDDAWETCWRQELRRVR